MTQKHIVILHRAVQSQFLLCCTINVNKLYHLYFKIRESLSLCKQLNFVRKRKYKKRYKTPLYLQNEIKYFQTYQ